MISSILFIFFTLLIVSFIAIHIQIFDFSSKFTSVIANVLLIFGGYALFVTGMKSIFIVPIAGLFIVGIILRKIKLDFRFFEWRSTLLFVGVISFFSFIFYFRNNELLLPHEDSLFWIRVGLSNQKFGVENINVFYNLFNTSYHKADLYHYIEIWAMNLGSLINHQDAASNLFFFAYPMGIIISCIGIKELLLVLFPNKFEKPIFINFSVLFFVIGFMFFSNIWDTVIDFVGIGSLPISGMSFVGVGKITFVSIIVIAIFLFIINPNSNTFISLLFTSFFYPPILPIVMLAVFLWCMYLNFSGAKLLSVYFFILIFLSLGFILFYTFFGNHSGSTISGFSLKEWLTISGWLKYLPAIIMKTFLIPLLCFSPILLSIIKKKVDISITKPTLFIVLLYFICLAVWAVFVKNVDANQAFLLLFGGILPSIMLYSIWNLIFIRRNVFGLFLGLIYILPGIVNGINLKSPVKKESISTVSFVKHLKNSRILFLTRKSDLNSIYNFNEKVYTGVNQFILYNPTIDLISVASSTIGDSKRINSSSIEMYNFYRDNSPYYKECGYVDITSKCFRNFLKKYKIDVICTKKMDVKILGWHKVLNNSEYFFYRPVENIK